MKAAPAIYGWDCPWLTFTYPGFDCGSSGDKPKLDAIRRFHHDVPFKGHSRRPERISNGQEPRAPCANWREDDSLFLEPGVLACDAAPDVLIPQIKSFVADLGHVSFLPPDSKITCRCIGTSAPAVPDGPHEPQLCFRSANLLTHGAAIGAALESKPFARSTEVPQNGTCNSRSVQLGFPSFPSSAGSMRVVATTFFERDSPKSRLHDSPRLFAWQWDLLI